MGMTNALNLLCGLALFLYGMHVMGEGLTRASGGRLEGILELSLIHISEPTRP